MTKSSDKQNFKFGWSLLFKYLFEYKSKIYLLIFLGLISAIFSTLIPYILGLFFDNLIDKTGSFVFFGYSIFKWVFYIFLFAILQLFVDILSWLSSKLITKTKWDIYANHIQKCVSHLLKLPLSFHHTESIGEIQEKINRSAGVLSRVVNIIIDLLPQFLTLIFGFIIITYIHYIFTIIFLFFILIYYLGVRNSILFTVSNSFKARSLWSKSFGLAHGSVANVETIKHMNTEIFESKTLKKSFFTAAFKWASIEYILVKMSFYQKILVTLIRIIVFVISVFMIKSNTISIGDLIALNGYAMLVLGPFVSLTSYWQDFQKNIVYVGETKKLLDRKIETYIPDSVVDIEFKGSVEFRNVSYRYSVKDKDYSLKNISFKVNSGEKIALVGESGSGKSTLINLMLGLFFASSGSILIDGVDIKNLDLNKLRQSIGIVPQNVVLFNKSLKYNIKYGSKSSSSDFKYAVSKSIVDKFAKKLSSGYNQLVGERGVKLSVGQKQRISIARAFLKNPKLLILDEPTSALDLKNEFEITNSLNDLMLNRTTFIVAHRLSTIRNVDRIFVLHNGKLVEKGTHVNLLKRKKGYYKSLYDLHLFK